MSALIVMARLSSPLAGDAPRLDAVLEFLLSHFSGAGRPSHEIDRNRPAPPQAEISIPLARQWLGPWRVARCSDPILAVPRGDIHEYIGKRIGVERASMLAERERRVVSVTNSWTKSYRLPLRARAIDRVCWIVDAHRRELLKAIRRCHAIGKKVADGYGQVQEWEITDAPGDHWWFAPLDGSTLLMATLPVGPWLPENLVGSRPDFGSCVPPYWHQDRYAEIVKPC